MSTLRRTIAEHFPTDDRGFHSPNRPSWSPSLTASSSSCGSLRSSRRLGDATVRMLAYNGSIPGPTLQGPAGLGDRPSTSTNDGDLDATVHWHGLRLENRYDGTHETQAPIPVGEQLHATDVHVPRSRRLLVPPAHPRGLRPGDGPVRQHPRRSRPTPTTGRRSTARSLLTLDDILIEDGKVAPFSRTETTHVGDGPLRQRHARRRRARPRADGRRAARSCAST